MHSGPLCFRREISPPSCSPSRGLFLQNMEVTWRVTRFHQLSLCRGTKRRSVWSTCGVSGPTDELFKTHQTRLFSVCWLGCAEEGIHRPTCSPSPSHPSPLSLNKTRTFSSGDKIKNLKASVHLYMFPLLDLGESTLMPNLEKRNQKPCFESCEVLWNLGVFLLIRKVTGTAWQGARPFFFVRFYGFLEVYLTYPKTVSLYLIHLGSIHSCTNIM